MQSYPIGLVHGHLIVISICIQEVHLGMTRGRVHQLINFRQRESIFKTSSIEACEVNAYSPLASLFLYHDRVGQPTRVKNFSYCTCLFQFFHFFYHCIQVLSCESPPSLFHYSGVEQYVQLVPDEVRVYPKHFVRCPCEDLDISVKKLDELGSLPFLQVCTGKKETV